MGNSKWLFFTPPSKVIFVQGYVYRKTIRFNTPLKPLSIIFTLTSRNGQKNLAIYVFYPKFEPIAHKQVKR